MTKPLPPGPYRFEPAETADTYRIFAAGDDNPMVEMIYIGGEEDFAVVTLGLARLFAAGPKLLESVQRAVNFYSEGLDKDDRQEMALFEAMNSAITEATGRADWTARDNEASEKEGWVISWAIGLSGERAEEYRLERVDGMAVFPDDAAAWAHVVKQAESGSNLHKRALAFIELRNPVEYSHIAKVASNCGRAA